MGILSTLKDCLIPWREAQSAEELVKEQGKRDEERRKIAENVAGLAADAELVRPYVDLAEHALEQENVRKHSVETRLLSIFGLCSVAGTIVFSAVVAIAAGSIPTHSTLLRWILVLGAGYLALQLGIAVLAAIRGLARSGYPTESLYELIRPPGAIEGSFLRARAQRLLDLVQEHRIVNNAKVTYMDVAHCAARNFVVFLLFFAFVVGFIALANPPIAPANCGAPNQLGCPQQKLATATELTQRAVLVHLASIGPFPDGAHELDQKIVLACLSSALSHFSRSLLAGWQVIGRTDKRELLQQRTALYGSNTGLATARAIWVRDSVLKHISGFDLSQASVSVSGPINIGTLVQESALQFDRAVDVYVLVTESRLLGTVGPAMRVLSPTKCP